MYLYIHKILKTVFKIKPIIVVQETNTFNIDTVKSLKLFLFTGKKVEMEVAQNLDPTTLQKETSQEVKEQLVLQDEEVEQKYFFFQLSDHRSPNGKNE